MVATSEYLLIHPCEDHIGPDDLEWVTIIDRS